MKVMIVSSVGGHLTEVLPIAEALEGHGHELVWVVNDASPVLPAGATAFRIVHGERDWGVLWNVVEMAAIMARERPDVLLSPGASPAVSAAVPARLLGIPVVYMELSCSVTKLSLTGRLMGPLSDQFFVQWEPLQELAPTARYEGGLM